MGTAETARGLVSRVQGLAYRVLDTVPPLRRTVDELVRVEFVDRSMVVAAQALLALIPLVVVLAAFLPADFTSTGVDRFEDVTGLAEASGSLVTRQVEPLTTGDDLRAQTGLVGLVVAVLSASSFARAVMRAYERVWALPTIGGIRAGGVRSDGCSAGSPGCNCSPSSPGWCREGCRPGSTRSCVPGWSGSSGGGPCTRSWRRGFRGGPWHVPGS